MHIRAYFGGALVRLAPGSGSQLAWHQYLRAPLSCLGGTPGCLKEAVAAGVYHRLPPGGQEPLSVDQGGVDAGAGPALDEGAAMSTEEGMGELGLRAPRQDGIR